MVLELVAAAHTDPGRYHDVNEDALLADDTHQLYAVSDGVGRSRGAALASRLVIDTGADHLRASPPEDADARRKWLLAAVKKAAAALAAAAKRRPDVASMSATLTLLRAIGDEAHFVHVGDSRAYLFRDGRCEQLTRDHSLAWEQLEAGAITKDALRAHPNQKLLTRTIRASSVIVLPELTTRALAAGDRVLLCTDGLTKMLPDERIAELVASIEEPAALCRALVDAANEAGGEDNVTVVVVRAS